MTEVEIAERIAREAHAGQVDKQGQPYIRHVERVVAAVSVPAKAAAWLHDVLEDRYTPRTWIDFRTTMRNSGIWPESDTWMAVAWLTRHKDETYERYISDIACHFAPPSAREIKIADLLDNLREGCPESLRSRYMKALERLTGEKQ